MSFVYEVKSKTAKWCVISDDPLEVHRVATDTGSTNQEPQSQTLLEEKNGYKKTVLECHKVLDKLGIPTAKGETCSDPDCQSSLGHRLRELQRVYTLHKDLIQDLKRVSTIEEVKQLLGGIGH